MKKVISIIALVLAMVMTMSVSAFAADPTFSVVENADVETDGSVIPEGTTVTPAADSIDVTTATTAGNYYGILLVEGSDLPTVDNAILYIDQATAADVTQAFSVLPNMTDLEDGDTLTLYISSNVAGAELIAIPMVYAAEEEVVVPDPDFVFGDVDGDGVLTLWDGYYIALYDLGESGKALILEDIEAELCVKFWDDEDESYAVERADVDGDGVVSLWDGYYIELYDLGESGKALILEDIDAGLCTKFWED